MRRRLYIPDEVNRAMAEHIRTAVLKAVAGYWSASEDEDVLTGHLGASLKIGNQKVRVVETQSELPGDWTWSVDYYKFRGRGKNATEHILGADGLFELRLQRGYRTETKSLLFQAKNNWNSDRELVAQCIKLSTWREAAFVLNYTSEAFEAFSLDEVLKLRGVRPSPSHAKSLANFLAEDFLDCLVGDTDLSYEPRARRLVWRAVSGEIVATVFSVKHRIRVNIKPPQSSGHDQVDRQIPNSEIYNYRMEARDEEILSLESEHSIKELKTARNDLALSYHPDRYNEIDDLLRHILNRRMQEINQAYERVYVQREHKKST